MQKAQTGRGVFIASPPRIARLESSGEPLDRKTYMNLRTLVYIDDRERFCDREFLRFSLGKKTLN